MPAAADRPPALADAALEPVVLFLTGARLDPRLLPWQELRLSDLRLIRAWATEAFAPATARRLLLGVRQMVRRARRDGTDSEASGRAPISEAQLVAVTVSRARGVTGPGLTRKTVGALFAACDRDEGARGRRDAALLSLLLQGGLLRRELCDLRAADYDQGEGVVLLRAGGKRCERVLVLDGWCRRRLDAWVEAGPGPGSALFVAIDAHGAPSESPLSRSAVDRLVARRGAEAGLPRLTPLDLRRYYLAGLREHIRLGVPVGQAGHARDGDDTLSLIIPALPRA